MSCQLMHVLNGCFDAFTGMKLKSVKILDLCFHIVCAFGVF